jgi:hypothetical protein
MTMDADLTIVILREIQGNLADLTAKQDQSFTLVKTELQVVSERLSLLERRDTIRDAQTTVQRRNDIGRDQRIDNEIKDLQQRISRLEAERK